MNLLNRLRYIRALFHYHIAKFKWNRENQRFNRLHPITKHEWVIEGVYYHHNYDTDFIKSVRRAKAIHAFNNPKPLRPLLVSSEYAENISKLTNLGSKHLFIK